MSRCAAFEAVAKPALRRWVRLFASMMLLAAVAACSSHPNHYASHHYNPSRYYAPPGPSSDPWGPYIHEASGRFGVPELWIRRVMRQESGGQEDVISWAGAMGLMQVMPDTYDGLRARYGLGDDPFDPHNNILAGTAYLREMYDRYGAPGFLAAYNAGPNRLDQYLTGGTPLPVETVNYVASIAPGLGPGTPLSGPLAVYGGRGAVRYAAGGCDPNAAYDPAVPCAPAMRPATYVTASSAGCDPDAAYDPNRPCRPTAPMQTAVAATPRSACDPDAAYDPTRPCSPAPTRPVSASSYAPVGPCDPDVAYDPSRPCRPPPSATTAERAPVIASALPDPPRTEVIRQSVQQGPLRTVAFAGAWGIQVGAFTNLATAEAAANNARMAAPDLLQTAKVELPPTTPFGGKVVFRARLAGISPTVASEACARLAGRGLPCVAIPPSKADF